MVQAGRLTSRPRRSSPPRSSDQPLRRFFSALAAENFAALPSPRAGALLVTQSSQSLCWTQLLWNAMKEGLLGDTLHSVHRGASSRRPVIMLHAGLDLSRNRLDVCLLSDQGEIVEEFAAPSDHDGVRALARRVLDYGEPVRAVIESMTGARFVHDTFERYGWDVLIADAQKVKGLAPLACKTDKIDARVLAVLSERDDG